MNPFVSLFNVGQIILTVLLLHNDSLLSLSQVIHALSTPPDRRPAYINYRNSKLTRLLQPYLSGNAFIALLCCVTPSRLYVEETRSTLKFATRAKLVTTKPTVNEVMDDTALIKKLQHDLYKAQCDLKRLEKREQLAEQSTLEALKEFKKLKSLIFGGGKLPQFQAAARPRHVEQPSPQQDTVHVEAITPVKEKSPKQHTPDNARVLSFLSKDDGHAPEQNSEFGGTRPREAIITPSPIPSPSRVSHHEPPPSEVVILREPTVQSPPRVSHLSEMDRSELLDAQHRAEFLGAKLIATEDLVESLFKDVESARGCIHQLVFKNVTLANRIEKLNRKLEHEKEERNEHMIQQYLLLKYSMYIGLLFFLFGNHELYFAAVMFLWLSLEVVT